MKRRADALGAQRLDEAIAAIGRHEDRIGVPAAFDAGPLVRQRHAVGQRRQAAGQVEGERAFAREDHRQPGELDAQDRGQDVRRHPAAALVDPGIAIDVAAQERGAIGAFLAEHLGAPPIARVATDERAAFAADDVLGAVEAEAAEVADGAERGPLPAPAQRVRRVFDHAQPVPRRDRPQPCQVGRASAVVEDDERLGPWGDRGLDGVGIEVEGDRVDVREDRTRAGQDHGVCRRDEGEARTDDLVSGADPGEADGGFERRGARVEEEGRDAEHVVEGPLGLTADRAVPDQCAATHGLRRGLGLAGVEERPVQRQQRGSNGSAAVESQGLRGCGGGQLLVGRSHGQRGL